MFNMQLNKQFETAIKERVVARCGNIISDVARDVFEKHRGLIIIALRNALEETQAGKTTVSTIYYNTLDDQQVSEYYLEKPADINALNDDQVYEYYLRRQQCPVDSIVNHEPTDDLWTDHRNIGTNIDNTNAVSYQPGTNQYYAELINNNIAIGIADSTDDETQMNRNGSDNIFASVLKTIDQQNDMHELKLDPVFNVFDDDTSLDNISDKSVRYSRLICRAQGICADADCVRSIGKFIDDVGLN